MCRAGKGTGKGNKSAGGKKGIIQSIKDFFGKLKDKIKSFSVKDQQTFADGLSHFLAQVVGVAFGFDEVFEELKKRDWPQRGKVLTDSDLRTLTRLAIKLRIDSLKKKVRWYDKTGEVYVGDQVLRGDEALKYLKEQYSAAGLKWNDKNSVVSTRVVDSALKKIDLHGDKLQEYIEQTRRWEDYIKEMKFKGEFDANEAKLIKSITSSDVYKALEPTINKTLYGNINGPSSKSLIRVLSEVGFETVKGLAPLVGAVGVMSAIFYLLSRKSLQDPKGPAYYANPKGSWVYIDDDGDGIIDRIEHVDDDDDNK